MNPWWWAYYAAAWAGMTLLLAFLFAWTGETGYAIAAHFGFFVTLLHLVIFATRVYR